MCDDLSVGVGRGFIFINALWVDYMRLLSYIILWCPFFIGCLFLYGMITLIKFWVSLLLAVP